MIFGVMSVNVFAEETSDPDVQAVSTDEEPDETGTTDEEEPAGTEETEETKETDADEADTEGSEETEAADPEATDPADAEETAEAEIPVVEDGATDASIQIVQQPADATANYPDPVSFQVKVDKPEKVASYQWILRDSVDQEFELHGESAATDTLELLSTTQDPAPTYFYCIITDVDGNAIQSEAAKLTISNKSEDKPVLYVGEYAIEPGGTIDVADTKMSGSGTVSLSSDGKRIVFNDFNLTNDWYSADPICAGGIAVAFRYLRAPTAGDYKVIINGDNQIHNVNDPTGENSGPDLLLSITHQSGQNPSTFSFEGSGDMTFKGGMYAILAESNLVFNTDKIHTVPTKTKNFGIMTSGKADITITSGMNMVLNTIGDAIWSGNDLILERGSKLTVNASALYTAQAPSVSYFVKFMGDLKMDKAELNVNGFLDPTLLPEGKIFPSVAGIFGEGDDSTLQASNSKINVHMYGKAHHSVYAQTVAGIGPLNSLSIDLRATDVDVKIDSDYIPDAVGIYVEGDFNVTDGSNINVYARGSVRARGISTSLGSSTDIFRVKNSNINVEADMIGEHPDQAFGIITARSCNISLAEGNTIKSKATGGKAFATLTGGKGDDEMVYQPGYVSSHINLGNTTECLLPAAYDINTTSLPGPAMPRYVYAETFYVLGDREKPVDEIEFGYVYSGNLIRNTKTSEVADVNYTGEEFTPAVTVQMGDTVLVKGKDYKLSYLNNKDVGTAMVIVEGMGHFKGFKVVTFNILPNGTKLSSATGGSGKFTVKWKKQATQTTGYQIQYSTSKTFASDCKTVTVSSSATTSKTVTGLKNKTYYVRVRTYKTVDGVKYYSGWSSKLIVPMGTTLSSVTKGKQKFTAKWKKQTTEVTGYQIQYSTSKTFASGNKTVTVSSSKTTSKTVKKLKSKKTYYVRIRTYKTVDGIKCYSGWSSKKSVKTT